MGLLFVLFLNEAFESILSRVLAFEYSFCDCIVAALQFILCLREKIEFSFIFKSLKDKAMI